MTVVRDGGTGARLSKFRPSLCHTQREAWAGYLTSLGHGFLIGEMGIITESISVLLGGLKGLLTAGKDTYS